MKPFAFILPNQQQDPRGSLKKTILGTIAKQFPWMKIQGVDNPYKKIGVQYAGPNDALLFGYSNKHDVTWANESVISRLRPETTFDIRNMDRFITHLAVFAYNTEQVRKNKDLRPDCYINNEPVKNYGDFIQVGNRIIANPEVIRRRQIERQRQRQGFGIEIIEITITH